MAYIVYENKIGFPRRLNQVFSFEDLLSAKIFSRARAKEYEEQGMLVNNFNGHDWIWYAFDTLNLAAGDKGIMLQIFSEDEIDRGEVLFA